MLAALLLYLTELTPQALAQVDATRHRGQAGDSRAEFAAEGLPAIKSNVTALYARFLFGVSASLFGAVVLISHESDIWHRSLAIAQIAGGVAMLLPPTVRLGPAVVGAVYAILSLASIPAIIAAPAQYVSYGNFFEQLSVVCGAMGAYAVADSHPRRRRTIGWAARLGLGLCAVSFALAQIAYLKFTAGLVPTWIPPSQMFWAIYTTIAFAFAALATLIDVYADLALKLMAVMLALFGVLVWVPHIAAHPNALANWSELAENYLIAAAAWMVADAVSSDQKELRPGLTAGPG